MTVLDRRAARVVLVDHADRILLLRGCDPDRPGPRWWFTPGGGLNPGESTADGAVRELFEETGLRVTPGELGEPVWHQVTQFSFDNRQYRQEQDFYLVRVAEWQVDTAGFNAEERATIGSDAIVGRAFTVFWPVNRATWLTVPKQFDAVPDAAAAN